MPRRWLSCLVLVAAGGLAQPAAARVDIRVDLSAQTMTVSGESGRYVWPISSARQGYSTPRGTFGVHRMEVMHRSHKYANAPMPHSLFFTGGYAIHGTYEVAALGEPASHGCIRIAPGNAAALYRMVQAEGARITISGSSPEADEAVASDADLRPRRFTRAHVRHRSDDGWFGEGSDDEGSLGYSRVVAPSARNWAVPDDDDD